MYEPQMTKQDRHNEEGRYVAAEIGVCEHGRPLGYSNYDVAFCGTCERNAYYEDMEEE